MIRFKKRLEILRDAIRLYGVKKALRFSYRVLLFDFYKYILRKQLVKTTVLGRPMWIDTRTDGISKVLFVYGLRERDKVAIVHEIIKPGNRIIDIGSNIGYYAIMEASLSGPTGSVTAIEPDPRNFLLLDLNRSLNGYEDRIHLYQNAVSSQAGTAFLTLREKSNLNTLLEDPPDVASSSRGAERICVALLDIVSLLRKLKPVDLIRMDIEGHEVPILQKIVSLPKTEHALLPRHLLFEVHPHLYGASCSIRPILTKLHAAGYCTSILTAFDDSSPALMASLQLTPHEYHISEYHVWGIYRNVSLTDTAEAICRLKCVRHVLLSLTQPTGDECP